jgi:hypothetical protein
MKNASEAKWQANSSNKFSEVMRFGKFRGEPVTTVPSSYLLWCFDTHASTDRSVVRELRRRGLIPSDTSLEACLALKPEMSVLPRQSRKRGTFLNEKKGKSPQLLLGAGSSFEREVAAARGRGAGRSKSQYVEGAEYRVKRAAWIEAGGNEGDCPF